jgi:drug/metabolite transporter (DMT)-like permease
VAVVVAAVVLGDRVGVAQVLGILLVLAGIALPRLPSMGRGAEGGAGT